MCYLKISYTFWGIRRCLCHSLEQRATHLVCMLVVDIVVYEQTRMDLHVNCAYVFVFKPIHPFAKPIRCFYALTLVSVSLRRDENCTSCMHGVYHAKSANYIEYTHEHTHDGTLCVCHIKTFCVWVWVLREWRFSHQIYTTCFVLMHAHIPRKDEIWITWQCTHTPYSAKSPYTYCAILS